MKHCGTKQIETKRLLLRRFTLEDAPAMYRNWASDETVTTFLRWPPHESVEVTKQILTDWVKQYGHEDYYQWAIVSKDTLEPIGSIGAVEQDDHIEMVHIGYCIGSAWWHQGITSEALAAIMHFFFEIVGVNRLESQHDPNNPNSGKVMIKCGMRYEGCHRQADWSNQGICDCCVYAILKEEYEQQSTLSNLQQDTVIHEQYKSATPLSNRISIHDRYSVNKQGFGNWVFAHYDLQKQSKILELGCGSGGMWKRHIHEIPKTTHITLTDVSIGMLDSAQEKLNGQVQFSFAQVDIQNIPYPDNSFDVVIANMMLYHVPNVAQALQEVQRVLKPDGVFYCATYGECGIVEYVEGLLADHPAAKKRAYVFTLENGEAQLSPFFPTIKKDIYEDALRLDSLDPLLEYLGTLKDMTWLNQIPQAQIKQALKHKAINGFWLIPKSYGMFIAKKTKESAS